MGDETVARYTGLYARENGAWYVRKRVPSDLVNVEKRSQIRVSLDTADRREAIKRYPYKLAEIEAHFDALRNGLQRAGKLTAALATGKLERLSDREVDTLVARWWAKRSAAQSAMPESPMELDRLLNGLEEESAILLRGESGSVQGLADQVLVEAGAAARPHGSGKIRTSVLYPVVDRSTPTYRHLCEVVERALKTEIALTKDRLLNTRETPHDTMFNPDGTAVSERGRRLPYLHGYHIAVRTCSMIAAHPQSS